MSTVQNEVHAPTNSQSSVYTFELKRKNDSVNCMACQKPRDLSKYRRHLLMHVKNKELSEESVDKILFDCRNPRKDTKPLNLKKPRIGYTCFFRSTSSNQQCNRVVLDLKRHLMTAHKVEPNSEEFENLIEKSVTSGHLERGTAKKFVPTETTTLIPKDLTQQFIGGDRNDFDMDNADPRYLDSANMSSNIAPSLDSANMSSTMAQSLDSTNMSLPKSCATALFSNTQPCSARPSYFSQSISFQPHREEDTFAIQSLAFIDTDKIIKKFESFLLTKGGGGRRIGPIKGDISSFRCLVKDVGWDNFWNPNSLNKYVTDASEGKLSPSTIYGRLRVYERFIDFLRIELPTFLPSDSTMKAIAAMVSNLKESLGKDMHIRNKSTMAASRQRMPTSLSVLEDWRSKRETVPVKQVFRDVTRNITLLNEKIFVQLRNFLIVEILLANAQRSGIIEGMMIEEVVTARSNVNPDNNHFIYVQNHKTGYKQPAIIFLDVEIFKFLLQYVTVLLPNLPPSEGARNLNDCRVFQTWRSNSLPSNTVCSCLRAGLQLYGIVDQAACPTQYRKAASTLISMHNPSMQESLSQFMCHERSTAERHYRHHMSHAYLSSVFTELAKCQANSNRVQMSARDGEIEDQMNTRDDEIDDQRNARDDEIDDQRNTRDDEIEDQMNTRDDEIEDQMSLSDEEIDIQTNASDEEFDFQMNGRDGGIAVHRMNTRGIEIDDQINTHYIEIPFQINTRDEDIEADNANKCQEFPFAKKSKYSRKRNGKSIFSNQFEEDLFFYTFESLIDKSLNHKPVTNYDVIKLAKESAEFSSIWERLVSNFTLKFAVKKVVDKIRTFSRNNRDFLL